MAKQLKLPPNIQQAAKDGLTGRVAAYIQDTCPRWSPTACYEAATKIVDKQQGE